MGQYGFGVQRGRQKSLKRILRGFVLSGGVVVPTALWWTFASLQSPVRVRFASPGDKDRNGKDMARGLNVADSKCSLWW